MDYLKLGLVPILLNGKQISGKIDLRSVIQDLYEIQYSTSLKYWDLDSDKRVLLIDDVDERTANNKNYIRFIGDLNSSFSYSVIFIDSLSNLSDKSLEHDFYTLFNSYSIWILIRVAPVALKMEI